MYFEDKIWPILAHIWPQYLVVKLGGKTWYSILGGSKHHTETKKVPSKFLWKPYGHHENVASDRALSRFRGVTIGIFQPASTK